MRARDLTVAGIASVVVAAGAREARTRSMRESEARIFAGLNAVSERWHAPVWTAMQLGSLGGSLATGAAVAAAGRPRLGRRLALVGSLAWVASKVVKPFARRGRPSTLVGVVRVLGREQAGLGYPSGHAAVAVAMAVAAAPHVPRRCWMPLAVASVGVGAARVYVGAHLPLDVAGGMALGLATERTVHALKGPA